MPPLVPGRLLGGEVLDVVRDLVCFFWTLVFRDADGFCLPAGFLTGDFCGDLGGE
jgi:hypothetical protein